MKNPILGTHTELMNRKRIKWSHGRINIFPTGDIYIDSRETKMTNYTNMQKGNKKLAIKPTYNFFMVRWNTQNRQI